MKSLARMDHAFVQKMIIVSLGLLTYVLVLTSCSYHTPCSAYDDVEQVEVMPED